MVGYIKRDIERFPVMGLNLKVNKEIFDDFKDYCKQYDRFIIFNILN